jgi:hypothetical protein
VRGGCLALLVAAAGCVAPPPADLPAAHSPAPTVVAPAVEGGTLRSEQITVEVQDGALVVRLTPLDPEVLRLAAPDVRRRLSAVAEAQRRRLQAEHADTAGLALFLVSFHSTEPDQGFDPEAAILEVAGQRRRPSAILPLSPGWGEQRLQPRTPESAIYAFPGPVSPFRPFTFHYGPRSSDAWREIVPRLEAERARVR